MQSLTYLLLRRMRLPLIVLMSTYALTILGLVLIPGDLVDNGIHVVGGGALLRGLDEVLGKATGLEVKSVDDPLTCVARGTSEYLDYLDDSHPTLESDEHDY